MKVDILIVGRGLAALQLHRALESQNKAVDVVTVGPNRPTGAAGLPEGIVHGFPGRSFNVPIEQWLAMQYLQEFLDELERDFPSLMERSKMVRPLLDGVTDRLMSSLRKKEEELKHRGVRVEKMRLPRSFSSEYALVYSGGAMVKIKELLVEFFRRKKERVIDDEVMSCKESEKKVEVLLKNGEKIFANRVLWAAGAGTAKMKGLRADVDRGSILYCTKEANSEEMEVPLWSAGVHLAKGISGLWGTGSTHFSAGSLDGNAVAPHFGECPAQDLLPKLERVMPNHSLIPSFCFTGTRLVSKDRRPFVGKISERQSVLCGFGGTALLWTPICAHWLVRELETGEAPPALVNVRR